MAPHECIEKDKELTLANKQNLLRNKNLLLWYKRLYQRQFAPITGLASMNILEIGSGTSPLKLFHKNVLTSDTLQLDYLDCIFDCHDIDKFDPIPDASLDVITMTNVLHHLKDPLTFLTNASRKLKSGGRIIMTEPYFSFLSTFIYKYLHHEPVAFDIKSATLEDVRGPLTSANSALPYLIFFSEKKWGAELASYYDFSIKSVTHYTSIAYMATGGISRNFHIPGLIYRLMLAADILMADMFPKVFSSFFILQLTKKPVDEN